MSPSDKTIVLGDTNYREWREHMIEYLATQGLQDWIQYDHEQEFILPIVVQQHNEIQDRSVNRSKEEEKIQTTSIRSSQRDVGEESEDSDSERTSITSISESREQEVIHVKMYQPLGMTRVQVRKARIGNAKAVGDIDNRLNVLR